MSAEDIAAVRIARQALLAMGRRVLAARDLQIRRVPRPLLRDPSAELRMSLDYALAQRVALSDDFFFVQIGAFDGRSADPLYGWVQAYRWRGLLVEPQPRFFAELVANYEGMDGLVFRQVAVGTRDEQRTLYTVADEPGVPHWAGLLASFDRDTLLSHKQFLPELENLVRSEKVQCMYINDLLAECQTDHIDLLQIDVEGYDHELIRALDLERFAPSIVRFEHIHLTREQHEQSIERLVAGGYRVCLEANDTLAYRVPDAADSSLGSVELGLDGPARLQAAHDAQMTAAHESHLEHVAELERRLAASEQWTAEVQREATTYREQSLDELRTFLTGQIESALQRAEAAERELNELRSQR